ncbi:unnamed protein product [Paramecium octaurelia]|uniref:Uncharacterized protein n=1 Tax=Paramecium octaurelia TaxID=43137 RepID=A0A8S1YQC2_PAROT|nr:unnamed protein product [Paramecium octaurelia]
MTQMFTLNKQICIFTWIIQYNYECIYFQLLSNSSSNYRENICPDYKACVYFDHAQHIESSSSKVRSIIRRIRVQSIRRISTQMTTDVHFLTRNTKNQMFRICQKILWSSSKQLCISHRIFVGFARSRGIQLYIVKEAQERVIVLQYQSELKNTSDFASKESDMLESLSQEITFLGDEQRIFKLTRKLKSPFGLQLLMHKEEKLKQQQSAIGEACCKKQLQQIYVVVTQYALIHSCMKSKPKNKDEKKSPLMLDMD